MLALLLWEQTEVTGCVRVERLCLQDAGKNVRQAKTSWSPRVTKWGLKNTRANELGKGMAGGGDELSHPRQDRSLPPREREADVTRLRTVVGSAGGTGAVPPC